VSVHGGQVIQDGAPLTGDPAPGGPKGTLHLLFGP
jgi:hypothetical protein